MRTRSSTSWRSASRLLPGCRSPLKSQRFSASFASSISHHPLRVERRRASRTRARATAAIVGTARARGADRRTNPLAIPRRRVGAAASLRRGCAGAGRRLRRFRRERRCADRRAPLRAATGGVPFRGARAVQAAARFAGVSAHCHQYLIVHAAVVERNDRAMLMPAPPGSGKSTLCAALVARGFRLLSDELALIDIATGRLVPLPRPISLKNASIGIIESFWKDGTIGAVVDDTVKGAVAHASAPPDSVTRSDEHASPAFVVVPRYRADSEITLEPLSRAAGFMQLADNAFNYSLHGRAGFDALARLIDSSTCFAFTYGGTLDDAVRTLEALYEMKHGGDA